MPQLPAETFWPLAPCAKETGSNPGAKALILGKTTNQRDMQKGLHTKSGQQQDTPVSSAASSLEKYCIGVLPLSQSTIKQDPYMWRGS